MIKLLQSIGFEIVRQKGSHVSMQKDKHRSIVPLHDELARGTLLGILKQCGLTREDLEKLVSK